MGILLIVSGIPGNHLPALDPPADMVGHFAMFLVLGAIIALRAGLTDFFLGRRVARWTKGGWIAPTIGVIYAILNEVQQIFIPNRSFSYGDIVANVAGLLVGFWLVRRWDRKRMMK
jgi:VanZ family protein